MLFSAILIAANEALRAISQILGASAEERATIDYWISRGRLGLEGYWEPELGLSLDYDVRAKAPLRVRTIAGFAPLVAGDIDSERLEAVLKTLDSPTFWATRSCSGRWRRAPVQ